MPEIQLPVFRGPLDLLLHLIERDDLDITAVSLVSVTDQYLRAIHSGERVDPHALAEFVAIGARLIYLKSRALLPHPPDEPGQTIEDDTVGQELVDLLVEYRRFIQVTDLLEERQDAGLKVYPRLAPPPVLPEGSGLDGVTTDAMRAIMLRVLARTPAVPRAILPRDTVVTLAERITDFRERLRKRGKFSFRRAIEQCRTRLDVVVSFLAILELLKAGECDARQSESWGDIEVVALPVAAAP
ncbi:MAG: segregation/condensation protein A [Dehalococcoidia bacterium]|nr:segregation/condensation protein A [Dehalococcoidia bacterium]